MLLQEVREADPPQHILVAKTTTSRTLAGLREVALVTLQRPRCGCCEEAQPAPLTPVSGASSTTQKSLPEAAMVPTT